MPLTDRQRRALIAFPLALGWAEGPLDLAAEKAAEAGQREEAQELRNMRDRLIDMRVEAGG